jgi:mannose-6-phosphate isomerase
MLYPLTFHPRLKQRVWGGRNLERLYRKPLPSNGPVGESWEIADRPGDISVVANGPLAGHDLHELMESRGIGLLGRAKPAAGRFPLLLKILDAEQTLSLQVHPSPAAAGRLGGEPKAELWYVASAAAGAELYAGLRHGVTHASFEAALAGRKVADCFHRIRVGTGDAMFLPSGRVHALGAGLVIFEIQQNSDTTYRVHDWDRPGLDGRPRELHLAQSLVSIDFADFEPGLVASAWVDCGDHRRRELASNPLFEVAIERRPAGSRWTVAGGEMLILAVLRGMLRLEGGGVAAEAPEGGFVLVPAGLERTAVSGALDGGFLEFLEIRAGAGC